MPLYDHLRSLLFRMDPESAHKLAMKAIRNGWVTGRQASESTPVEAFGIKFKNPVGLAAGFDKDAHAVNSWKNFGFGFAEIGTITRYGQPGNPKPRMFRVPDEKALINRMGFNNSGADVAARRLDGADPGIPLGINLGKSKVTELEDAPEDYAYSFKLLKEFGDYFVVNVSSPNTPGLRELQDKSALTKILWRLKEIDSEKPMLVKIAPDLTHEQIDDVLSVSLEMALNGVIVSNTTISREVLRNDPGHKGGISGAPLKPLADAALKHLAEQSEGKLTLIGSGGVMTPQDAKDKLDLGATLVQVYSGFVYGGPDFPAEVAEFLA